MFCQSCGSQLTGDETFCGRCGTRVQTIPPEKEPPAPESEAGQSPVYTRFEPVPVFPYKPGNYMKDQIKRVSHSRMILFGILFAFSMLNCLPMLALSRRASDLIGAAIFFGVPTLLFLLYFLLAIRDYSNYRACGIYKKLYDAEGLSADAVDAMLNDEIEKALLFSHKRLTLTEHWICIQGRFSLHIFPADKLIWAYTYVMNGTFYQVIFALSNRKRRSIHTLRQKTCDEILAGVMQSYPHVLLGFSKMNRQLYKDM